MEEQRRVLEFLRWQTKWWLSKQSLVVTDDPALEEGLKAYAQRQAALRVNLDKHFMHIWRNVQRYVELADGVNEGGDTMSSITFG